MEKAGVPIVPGRPGAVSMTVPAPRAKAEGDRLADCGQGRPGEGKGGKGFRVAMEESDAEDAFEGRLEGRDETFLQRRPDSLLPRGYLGTPAMSLSRCSLDAKGNVIHRGRGAMLDPASVTRMRIESTGTQVDEERCESDRARIARTPPLAVSYRSVGTVEGCRSGRLLIPSR